MAGERFLSVDVAGFHTSLHDLHLRVASGCGRIEVTGLDPEHICVLISKTELDCLEQALDILSGTDAFKHMCDDVTKAASHSGAVPVNTDAQDSAAVGATAP